ncbi:hypothetical protein DACRYDRAFT_100452 [Dacryopinax primogenitus]|uniref:Zn(2)-C6 fungal-type domain-containing protein n=1 Tax=Dacryopinax primogenitus (strain DJM 731) TaxID=1858805 RepID=M5G724_DACPD|nr:uncharacterized protein DACRYDRAFT_100452 [Dacryopinax primogenitus]EJU01612.1 hypothetical protein DACRYDRAFT_100452 [Dacryopinax primogenitus]
MDMNGTPLVRFQSSQQAQSEADDRIIRRRSSKACDNCRKAKCKCEPTGPNQPCSNCVSLRLTCTFLGPSRKRGPPKGYIDKLEAKMHRLQALIGTIMLSDDARAQSIVNDLSGDPLAREVLAQVEASPFGSAGRSGHIPMPSLRFDDMEDQLGLNTIQEEGMTPPKVGDNATHHDLGPSTHFTASASDWQNALHACLRGGTSGLPHLDHLDTAIPSIQYPNISPVPDDGTSPRQRRRLDAPLRSPQQDTSPTGFSQGSGNSLGNQAGAISSPSQPHRYNNERGDSFRAASPDDPTPSEDGDENVDLADVVGQLSIDENDQVRYHGKASGLHLLSRSERHREGIWRFPPARVWPPSENHVVKTEEEILSSANARDCLPSLSQQQHLIDLYFTYVQPVLPIIPKRQFMELFRERMASSDANSPADNVRGRIPTLLLLAMFTVAARYTTTDTPLPIDGKMWNAGDKYLTAAKLILNEKYASSQPETCQALILLSYREIGIGAMAQSFLYTGMAVRMAQDLGLHRSMEKWHPAGQSRFTEEEKQTRRRIWWACVILDRYVSTYIGRPMGIFERDYDTALATENDPEEVEVWRPLFDDAGSPDASTAGRRLTYEPKASHALACFNASATLASILGRVYENLYTIRTNAEGAAGERILRQLDKRLALWLINLPDSLKYQPSNTSVPPPHILTLHMQFYCALLLLHRPFITGERLSAPVDDLPSRAICSTAANAISTIISTFKEAFGLKRCPAICTFYVFSASIMHVFNATVDPSDVQSRVNLAKCMAVLGEMDLVWPSAGRARELLNGLVDLRDVDLSRPPGHPEALRSSNKRAYPDDDERRSHELAQQLSNDARYLLASREDALGGPAMWNISGPTLHNATHHSDSAWNTLHGAENGDRSLSVARSSEDLHGALTNSGYAMSKSTHPLQAPYPSAGDSHSLGFGSPESISNVFPPFSPPRTSSFWNDQMAMPFGDPALASAFMGLPVNMSHMSDFSDVRGDGLFMQSLGERPGTPEGDVPTSYHLLNSRERQFTAGI